MSWLLTKGGHSVLVEMVGSGPMLLWWPVLDGGLVLQGPKLLRSLKPGGWVTLGYSCHHSRQHQQGQAAGRGAKHALMENRGAWMHLPSTALAEHLASSCSGC